MACTRVIRCEKQVYNTATSPDGQLLAVGVEGSGVLLLDVRSGESRTLQSKLTDARNCALSLAFSPAGTSPLLLAAGLSVHTVRVWDCSSGARVAELQGHTNEVYCVAFSPDGRLLASASIDKTVRLWRTDDWRASPAVMNGHTDYVYGVSFSCDGRLLASNSVDHTVRLWHILDRDAAIAHAVAAPEAVATAGPALEIGQTVLRVAFSPVDSRLLACGGRGGFLALVRVGAGDGDGAIAVEHKLQGHTYAVRRLAFSPCGRTLASGSWDKTVRLWSVASGACLRVLRGHTGWVVGVTFFPNGKQLASGSVDKTVRIWTLCAWSDQTHHLFGAPLKAAVFTLMCVRARLEQEQEQEQRQAQGGQHALQLPRLPMEVWLLVFGQLQLALKGDVVSETKIK